MKELAKSQSYCNLIAKVKGLVKFVKISSVAQEKLTALCGKVVMKDCATTWNSVLYVIERLLDIRTHLEQVLKELKHDSLTNTSGIGSEIYSGFYTSIWRNDGCHAKRHAFTVVCYLLSVICELLLHLQDPTLPKLQAQTLLLSLRKRFSQFWDCSSPNFDALPAAACLLDTTVSV